jgi:hypothetical protein
LTWYAHPVEVYGCGPRRIEELETGQNRKKKKKKTDSGSDNGKASSKFFKPRCSRSLN